MTRSNRDTALLILAHGSPRPESNAGLYAMAKACEERSDYALVQVGFLECNDPSIPAAIDLCAEARVARIITVPYFLHTGTHVSEDLPQLLEAGRNRHAGVEFLLADFIGRSTKVTEILGDRIEEARLKAQS